MSKRRTLFWSRSGCWVSDQMYGFIYFCSVNILSPHTPHTPTLCKCKPIHSKSEVALFRLYKKKKKKMLFISLTELDFYSLKNLLIAVESKWTFFKNKTKSESSPHLGDTQKDHNLHRNQNRAFLVPCQWVFIFVGIMGCEVHTLVFSMKVSMHLVNSG